MAKKKQRKPKVAKRPRIKNSAPNMVTAQGLKKGFIIPSNGGFQ